MVAIWNQSLKAYFTNTNMVKTGLLQFGFIIICLSQQIIINKISISKYLYRKYFKRSNTWKMLIYTN